MPVTLWVTNTINDNFFFQKKIKCFCLNSSQVTQLFKSSDSIFFSQCTERKKMNHFVLKC